MDLDATEVHTGGRPAIRDPGPTFYQRLPVESVMLTATCATHHQISDRMRSAFASLTVTQQQAVFLNVVEGWPIGYVAHQLGLPRDSAERIACAARMKLYQAVAR